MRMKEIVQIDCTDTFQLKLLLIELKREHKAGSRSMPDGWYDPLLYEQIKLVEHEITVMEGK